MSTNINIPTLIVLVLGDSSVGKTSFVRMVCHDQTVSSPPPVTVGCHIDVKLHERRDRHQNPNLYFIEFHDVGGSVQHKESRSSVFYDDFDGIILVSDLTSRQSYDNLKEWLFEVIRHRSRQKISTNLTTDFLRNFDVPILLVHTKFDESNGNILLNSTGTTTGTNLDQSLLSESLLPNYNRKSTMAKLLNCDEIFINCYSKKKFSVDTQNVTKLNTFFEKMIKKTSAQQLDQFQQFDYYNSENHFIR